MALAAGQRESVDDMLCANNSSSTTIPAIASLLRLYRFQMSLKRPVLSILKACFALPFASGPFAVLVFAVIWFAPFTHI